MTDILPGCRERTNWDNSDSNVSVFFIVFHRNLIQMILLIKVWFVIQCAFVHLFFNHNYCSVNVLVGCCNPVFSLVEVLLVYWSQITSTKITTKFIAMAENSRFAEVSDEFLDHLLDNSIRQLTKNHHVL